MEHETMSKERKKGLLGEFTGKVGPIVVKYQEGKYIVTTPPVIPNKPSTKQLTQRERFKEAVEYARLANLDDSPTKEIYEEAAKFHGKYPFRLAMADFFHPAQIAEVDSSEYHGRAGDILTIKVRNEVPVAKVTVSITDGDGNGIERGLAIEQNFLEWTYTATQDLPGDDAIFVIHATDLPGNTTEETVEEHLVNFGDADEAVAQAAGAQAEAEAEATSAEAEAEADADAQAEAGAEVISEAAETAEADIDADVDAEADVETNVGPEVASEA